MGTTTVTSGNNSSIGPLNGNNLVVDQGGNATHVYANGGTVTNHGIISGSNADTDNYGIWVTSSGTNDSVFENYGSAMGVLADFVTTNEQYGWMSNVSVSGTTFIADSDTTTFDLNLQSGSGSHYTIANISAGAVVNGGSTYGWSVINVTGSVSNFSANGNNTSGDGIQVKNGGNVINADVQAGGYLVVSKGGNASGGTIETSGNALISGATSNLYISGGSAVIFTGGQGDDTHVENGGHLTISSGGIASNSVIEDTGTETVELNGSATGTTVSTGGLFYVSGSASATKLIGGYEEVYSGGVENGATATSGGHLIVDSQGVASSISIQGSGSYLEAKSGGTIVSGTVGTNAIYAVDSGATASAVTVENTGAGYVHGTSVSGAVQSGGNLYVDGTAEDTTVIGLEQLTGSGSETGAQVFSSGSLVASGANSQVISSTVEDGGTITLLSGTSGSNNIANDSGKITISSGATTRNDTINSGGKEYVYGSSVSAMVSGSGAWIGTESGGVTSGATINADAVAEVQSGGKNNSTIINGGSEAVDEGGSTYNTDINSGNQIVSAGGSANATTVSGISAYQFVSGDNAIASGTVVHDGGQTSVGSGGTLISATLDGTASGVHEGYAVVLSGGTVSGTTINTLGHQEIQSGGVASNTVNNAYEEVKVGGSSINPTVNAGGNETVEGVVSGATVNSSGGMYLNSGGSSINAHIVGGTEVVSSGAFDSGAQLSSGASLLVSGGASASGVSATDPNTWIDVYSDAKLSGATITNSAGIGVENGGTATAVTLESGANAYVNGTNISGIVSGGGILNVLSTGVASGSTINSGGILNVDSGGTLSGITTLASGGLATLYPNAGGTIVIDGTDNTGVVISGLADNTSDTTVSTVFSSFDGTSGGDSDGIELAGLKAADITSVTYPTGDTVKLTLAQGGSITLNIDNVATHGFTLETASNGDVIYEVCFLAGSMIRTPSGAVAVEELKMGDTVMTWDWKAQTAAERPVVWAGRKNMTVKTHLADDEAGYPVRIFKDAIADNVPSQDLLVTPEHCLFFEDKFVPVRMLVNGRSIAYDRSITTYDYFHIETEEHAVIWANDTLTESYLDTGNRATFRQDGDVVRFVPKAPEKTWDADGAASLTVERAVVEPLFHALAQRAASQGFASHTEVPDVTQHSDIHLVTARGQSIRPVRQLNDKVVFMIPAGVEAVQIATRTSRPSDTIGPFVDDRRHLGILVGQVTLFDGKTEHAVTAHLEQSDLTGWDVQEPVPCRWTNGNATLPLPVVPNRGGLRMLTLQIIAAGPYLAKKTDQKADSLKTAV